MDSEKIIIELIKPLLKDYLTFTKGEVPSDWVNVREERKAYIERLQREIDDLKQSIKKAEEFNEDIEKNAVPSLRRRKPGMADDLEEDIKENKEKIETYRKKLQVLEEELKRAQEELEEANAQIETRRQAGIVKIREKIRDNVRQYVEEEKEASKEDQEKLEALEKYEEISDEEIQNLAFMVEDQEKSEIKAAKIEAIKLDLEGKEKNCKDLLTEDYYLAKEEYIKKLEEARTEEVEEIKAVTIGTIYEQVFERAIEEQDIDKANSVYDTVKKIVDREEIIRKNILVAEEENKRKQAKYWKSDIQFEEEKSIVRSITQAIKEIPNKISKAKQAIRNIGIGIVNWSFGMKLLGDGKEEILIDDEQIHERWQKNEEKHEQLMKDIIKKRQSEPVSIPNGDMEETSQTDLQKQLEVAQELRDEEEVDYISRLMQAASQVKIKTDEEKKKEWEAYRKANNIEDKTEQKPEKEEFVAMERLNKPLIIPEFLKKNSYKQGLNAGISQEEQRKHARLFQKKADKKDRKAKGIVIGG